MGPLAYARVVEVRPEGHSVDVVLMQDGRRLPGVQILSGAAGGDFGRYGLGIPTETGYDAKTTQQRDVFCIVGWVGREPFVLGFLFPQVNEMLFEDKERSIDRHPSDVYKTIDDKGNIEIFHPSGTFVRIGTSPKHEDLTGKDYRGRFKIKNNTDQIVHIHVEHSTGTYLDVDESGNVVVHGPVLYVDVPKSIFTGNMTVDGHLHVAGDVGTDGSLNVAGNIGTSGSLHSDGDIGAGGDVVAGGGSISLKEHIHPGVMAGSDMTQAGQTGGNMPSMPEMPAKDSFTPDSDLS